MNVCGQIKAKLNVCFSVFRNAATSCLGPLVCCSLYQLSSQQQSPSCMWSSILCLSSAGNTTLNLSVVSLFEFESFYLYIGVSILPVSLKLPVSSCCHSNRGGASSSSSPVISTNSKDSGALVTVSRVTDGEPISIFLDPNCPDYSANFLRWEALQGSLLRALSSHKTEEWPSTGLFQKLSEDLKVLSSHAHNLRLETDSLKRGQGVLDQRLDGLQSEQSRIIQVLTTLKIVHFITLLHPQVYLQN